MLGTATRQKYPIIPDFLLSICRLLKFKLISHSLTLALFIAAFFSFLRKTNLVSPTSSTFDCDRHLTRRHQIHRLQLLASYQVIQGSPIPIALFDWCALVPVAPQAPFFSPLRANGPTPVNILYKECGIAHY